MNFKELSSLVLNCQVKYMEQFILENQWIIFLLVFWTLPWKAVALWKASQNKQKIWFIVLLIFNTLALLEIAYIFYFSKKTNKEDLKNNG